MWRADLALLWVVGLQLTPAHGVRGLSTGALVCVCVVIGLGLGVGEGGGAYKPPIETLRPTMATWDRKLSALKQEHLCGAGSKGRSTKEKWMVVVVD